MKLLINIDVDDLEKGINFYQNSLGLRLGRRLFDGTVAEMVGGSSNVYLLTKPSGTSASPQVSLERDYRRHWTPVHLDFIVANLDEAMSRWTVLGASLDRKIQLREFGRMANMADPFGNGFDLIEFSAGGYEAVSQ